MTHMKDRLLLKPQLSDFGALVLYQAVVFLLLTHSSGGQSQVIGTSQAMVAMVGADTILPCHLETAVDATDLTVEWARPDLEPRFVHLRRDSKELVQEGHQLFTGRTSLSTNKLKCGDVSLKLSNVRLSDAGTYRCLVPDSGTESVVVLSVGSVSSTGVEISKVSNGVLLVCESAGWYPEPEVLWLDSEGNLLSAGPPETVRGPDDLYTVSSRVTVEKRHGNSFTCRVQQRNINQTTETTLHLPVSLFMFETSTAARIIICLVVSIVPVVAVVVVVMKWGRNKKDHNTEYLMVGEGDRETPMTGRETIIYLDNTKAKLDEELQKTEEELKHVKQMVERLTKQKTDLKNQTQGLNLLLQEDKAQMVECEKKLRENPKVDKDAKIQKRQKAQKAVEWRKREHDELSENTQELLETTEQMIIEMSVRKGKLEREKERIMKHLEVTERRREEVQKKLQSEGEEEMKHAAPSDPSPEAFTCLLQTPPTTVRSLNTSSRSGD
ncbi:butyrophilin subfamily 2 member A1-like isoform X2 [Epinephelus moara]|uniref:butyrophilin subfamily 2 member A1-like isoform X2 n=1 Tax=Epinephelus moara TaxID=300413 RepID=UPI00214EB612|nr:butyrophilin subfamily 2 member A1-like isoform X2 [Epinephelus moara]